MSKGERVSLRAAAAELGFRSLGAVISSASPIQFPQEAPTLSAAIRDALLAAKRGMANARARHVYRNPAWDFASALRDRPELESLDAVQAAERIGPLLETLGGWDCLENVDSFGQAADPHACFLASWLRVDKRPLRTAAMAGKMAPVEIPELPESKAFAGARQFASMLAHLAYARGDGRLFVSCRAFSEELGVSPNTVSNWRRLLEGLGLLVQVQKASPRKLATEFEWRGPYPLRPWHPPGI